MSLNVPDNLKYAKSHEWLKVDGETGVVGITDHAQNELTDVVFAELPEVGRVLSAGEACAVVESVKTAGDVYSPVSGEVIEVNEALVDNPALINESPFENGWFFKVRLSKAGEVDALLSAEDYKSLISA
jgi:glycine cleavage system H protein